MKKLALIAFLGFSAAAFCVNQGHSQFSNVNAVSAYSQADTTPMKKTTKTTHKTMKKTSKPKKDSTQS